MLEHHLWSAKNFPKFWRDGIAHHEITMKENEQQELEFACEGLWKDRFRMLLSKMQHTSQSKRT